MDRKLLVVLGVLVVLVAGFFLVRDPIAAADTVRAGWRLVVDAITTVVQSLTMFFRHLFYGG
ncbi:hypothetical protein [Saccharopolyspora rectivirgula]|uniref:Uncharacterized protein n=1 Tax=Saccharopolyspora rectivirgula TaxID=28042 RepID=A0A073AX12_9PSEU|nr:hypothetical protein [Saccharopolyspora rectivirgula]KEI43940.1 hypothetical protein GU90_13305 [Saccharopolyspora rectivirgula]